MKKLLSILLAALLALAGLSALAEPEAEDVFVADYCEELNGFEHTAMGTIWHYPIVDGVRASGKPLGDAERVEAHSFVDGTCIYCDHACPTPEDILPSACGIGVLKGTAAGEALRVIRAALPEDAGFAFADADDGVAAELTELLDSDADPEALAAAMPRLLAAFPEEAVDGADCRVVTLAYTAPSGEAVTERCAFDAEGALAGIA